MGGEQREGGWSGGGRMGYRCSRPAPPMSELRLLESLLFQLADLITGGMLWTGDRGGVLLPAGPSSARGG
eukprot:2369413-Pyramimonas_sp.AAC.1